MSDERQRRRQLKKSRDKAKKKAWSKRSDALMSSFRKALQRPEGEIELSEAREQRILDKYAQLFGDGSEEA